MNEIPKGWTRGGAIEIHTAPSPWLKDRDIVVVKPKHPVAAGGQVSQGFTEVQTFELWRRWWFDVEKAPFVWADYSMPFEEQGTFTREQWDRLKPPQRPEVLVTSNPPAPVPVGHNPFAPKKSAPPPNPFTTPPKSKNPFD